MNFLDIRTVLFSQLVTDAICTIVLAFLWLQNRKRYAGISFWVVDFIFQTIAILLVVLRGSIPDWLSIGLSSPCVVAGAFVGYLGLERFVGKKSSQIPNYVFLALFLFIQFYFVFILPDLEARNLILSLGLLLVCFQCTWLLLRHAGSGLIHTTQAVGAVFGLFCLVSLLRVFVILANPAPSNDFFQSGLYDTLILMSYQILLVLLTFGLVLMVNRRLLMQVRTQEEKFTKAFHSSPYAILITRLSDGLIVDVNRGFEEMVGYLPSESIGKTTFDLQMWARETDRQEVVSELSARGELQGRQFLFRTKAGLERTVLFYATILIVENEELILSSFSDITEQIQADEIRRESEGRYRSLFENMLNGFAYCQMIFEGERPQDFIYLDVNHAFESLTGLKDVVGRKASEVIPGIRESDPELIATYGRVALTGQPETFETYVEAMKMWFSISVYGPKKGFFVAVFDVITERKQAETKIAMLAKFPDENPYPILRLDAQGVILYANDASHALLTEWGCVQGQHAPKQWQDVVTDVLASRTHRTVETSSAGRIFSVFVVPIVDSNYVNFYGRDVTERNKAEEALRESENRYRELVQNANSVIMRWRHDGTIAFFNEYAQQFFGYSAEEVIGQPVSLLLPQTESTGADLTTLVQDIVDHPENFVNQVNENICRDGRRVWMAWTNRPTLDENGQVSEILAVGVDITERIRVEDTQKQSELMFRTLFELSPDAITLIDPHDPNITSPIIDCNETACRMNGYPREELIGHSIDILNADPYKETDRIAYLQKVRDAGSLKLEVYHRHKNGTVFPVEISTTIVKVGERELLIGIDRDITERKRAEQELRESETKFKAAFENAPIGISLLNAERTMIEANATLGRITHITKDGLSAGIYRNRKYIRSDGTEMPPGEFASARTISKNQPVNDVETGIVLEDGQIVWTLVSATPLDLPNAKFILITQDITGRKQVEADLRRTLEELKRSNAELEQFAYVASHDLQEPLRMVSSYVQLLERRYKGKLDKDADEFIGFAVDGAGRMQRLINDLLAFSRVGTRSQPFTNTSSEAALAQALDNLQVAIQENKAGVTHDPLPEVFADGTQLVQLFQNLIANAIKFHGDKAPQIRISVDGNEKEWVFSVHDNGIGIDPQYTERIFIIFQRLHGHNQYPGTGIGLAMCKKIVQQHGGRIWVESQLDQGATFFFSLPKREPYGNNTQSKRK